LFLILADSAKPVDQALQRAKNGMKEGALPLKNPIHESANGLCNGNQESKKDHDLGNTE